MQKRCSFVFLERFTFFVQLLRALHASYPTDVYVRTAALHFR